MVRSPARSGGVVRLYKSSTRPARSVALQIRHIATAKSSYCAALLNCTGNRSETSGIIGTRREPLGTAGPARHSWSRRVCRPRLFWPYWRNKRAQHARAFRTDGCCAPRAPNSCRFVSIAARRVDAAGAESPRVNGGALVRVMQKPKDMTALQWLAPSMARDGLLKNGDWVLPAAAEAEKMFSDTELHLPAQFLSALNRFALDYIRQAPVLVVAAAHGR